MKKAEDFRKAFGPAEAGFERTVRNTLNKLLLQEDKSAFRRLYRYRIPALAMAMVLLLSVGFMGLTGRLGVIAVPDQTRTGAAQERYRVPAMTAPQPCGTPLTWTLPRPIRIYISAAACGTSSSDGPRKTPIRC